MFQQTQRRRRSPQRFARVLIGQAALAVLCLAFFLTPTAEAAPANSCPNAFFVGVRGSGDPFDTSGANGGMGWSVKSVYDNLVSAMPDARIEAVPLDYPAIDAKMGFALPRAPLYRDSVSSGSYSLDREVFDLVSRCPVTPIVMAGHSQGAQVIGRFLATENSAGYDNLVGFALLGDPTRYPARAYNVAPNPPGSGVFYAPGFTFLLKDMVPPPRFWGRIDSYCIHGDPICAGGPREWFDTTGGVRAVAMFATSTHSHYVSTGFSETAGKALGERLTAAFAATRPDEGTFGPTILNPSILATGIAATDSGRGYWLSMNRGGLDGLGDAGTGDQPRAPLNAPVVGIAGRPGGKSYWMVGADGSVYAGLPDDPLPGSMANRPLNDPVVGIAPTPSGNGYWLTAADGGVFAFGDAPFHGSLADEQLNAPVVGIASTPSGNGYWLTAADGGVFAFGDAPFHGSLADEQLNAPVVGIASTPSGNGYWLTAADGGVFAFGDAPFLGSTADRPLTAPVAGIAATPTGDGYWLAASDGSVFGFGNAPLYEK